MSMHQFCRSIVVLLAVSAIPGLSGHAASAAENNSKAVVEGFHDMLISVMKEAKSLKVAGRYKKIEPVMAKSFDLAFMIRVASGTSWRKISDAEKKKLAAAFRHLSIATYAYRFDGFSGQSFKTVAVEPGPRKTTLVKTQLLRPNENPVKLTYVMKKSKGACRIVDILLGGGISELAVRHSEYRTILKKQGPNSLAKILNRKADQYLNEE